MFNMNHFSISIFKSIIRLIGSIAAFALAFINVAAAISVFAGTYTLAEVLGILEEVFDKRKED